jgi:GDPmannose 4,6-dehydratase
MGCTPATGTFPATGRQHPVREYVPWAAGELEIVLRFEGNGSKERGVVEKVTGYRAPGVRAGDVIDRVAERY